MSFPLPIVGPQTGPVWAELWLRKIRRGKANGQAPSAVAATLPILWPLHHSCNKLLPSASIFKIQMALAHGTECALDVKTTGNQVGYIYIYIVHVHVLFQPVLWKLFNQNGRGVLWLISSRVATRSRPSNLFFWNDKSLMTPYHSYSIISGSIVTINMIIAIMICSWWIRWYLMQPYALSSQVQREDMGMLAHGLCPGSAATAGRYRWSPFRGMSRKGTAEVLYPLG